jgi:hypothetical protein
MQLIKILLTILSLSSLANAEDIYDRINECDKRAERSDCMMALIRELAQKVESQTPSTESASNKEIEKNSYEKVPSEYCSVSTIKIPGENDTRLRIVKGADYIYDGFISFDMPTLQYITSQWKQNNCSADSKAKCDLYPRGEIGIIHATILSRPLSDAPAVFKELQQSICR